MQRLNVPGPKAKAIIDRDAKVVSPSYPRVSDLVMDYGKGVEVWDVDGNRYIDFVLGQGPLLLGHCHPVWVKAMRGST